MKLNVFVYIKIVFEVQFLFEILLLHELKMGIKSMVFMPKAVSETIFQINHVLRS